MFFKEKEQGFKLPDISYEKFEEYMHNPEDGDSEVAYNKYLRKNGMCEMTDLDNQSTSELTLILEQPYRGRVLKFKCIYDSDSDEDFNEEDYFKDWDL